MPAGHGTILLPSGEIVDAEDVFNGKTDGRVRIINHENGAVIYCDELPHNSFDPVGQISVEFQDDSKFNGQLKKLAQDGISLNYMEGELVLKDQTKLKGKFNRYSNQLIGGTPKSNMFYVSYGTRVMDVTSIWWQSFEGVKQYLEVCRLLAV